MTVDLRNTSDGQSMQILERENASLTCKEPNKTPCRLCGAQVATTFVDLGMSPLCESFLTATQLDAMEPYFPLSVLVCHNCFLVQVREYVKPEFIFSEYAYFSSYSTSWVEHARKYCCMIKNRLQLTAKTQVFEVASNDGYLLQHFLPFDIPVIGIEPAENVAAAARAKGIPTFVEFFGLSLANRLVSEGYRADLIIGNNVLAQVPDLNDFVAGMARLIAPDGVITLEFPHLERLIEENQFDTIYHEHFSYFSLSTVCRLADKHCMKVFDVEMLPTHGGSLRVYLALKDSCHQVSTSVTSLISHEHEIGLRDLGTYVSFGERVARTKRDLLALLIECKNSGAKICGYGAPGKGNTLLNYCGIGPDFLDFTVDRNPYKHGRYTPGQHVPIRPLPAIDEARPDYLLVLPWNLRTEIFEQMRHVGEWGCKFIVPIPSAYVVDPREVLQ